jgi:hypothetical protein
MIKRTAVLSLSLFAFAACSGSSSPDAGSSSGGSSSGSSSGGSGSSGTSSSSSSGAGISVTLASVGVHPAAVAALTALGLTPPDLSSGYHVVLQAVTLKAGAPSLTDLGSVELTSANDTGPINFPNLNLSGGIASLGIISAVVADDLPDGGTPAVPAPPTCAQLAATPVTGFTDYYVIAGAQVYFGTPTANITNGVAFALPESYVAVLDCAAGLVPGATGAAADLLNQGFALLYASADAAAAGAAVSGAQFSGGGGAEFYYPAGYAAGSASANGPTSANGISTITGVAALGTVSWTPASGGAVVKRDISTPAGSAYQVFFAPGT